MTTQWAWIGPLGSLRKIPNPAPGLTVQRARRRADFTVLDGTLRTQAAPHAPRTWALAHTWHSAETIAWLAALAEEAIPGPHMLYTADAAALNLLPSALAAPCRMGTAALGATAGQVPVVIDGAPVPMTGVVQQPTAGAWSQTVALRPSLSYTLSAWATATGATVEWRTVTAAGAQVATGTLSAAVVAGGYRGTLTIAAGATVAGIQLRTSAGPRTVGGIRLTEGPHSVAWVPGRGVHRVVVSDPDETLQLVEAGAVLLDTAVTIREVG